MVSSRARHVCLSIAIVGSTGLSSGLVGLASANATSAPKLVVAPSVNLHTGEAVRVTGSGFTPGDSVYVVECLATATGAAGCNTLAAKPATISATGLLPKTYFKVMTGKIGTGTCGTKASNLKSCAITVGNISGGDSAVARIVFKAKK